MAQYQIYKPNAPGGSRELQKDLFTGSEADIQKRKASGEDLSYSQVDAPPDAAGAPPGPTGGGGGGGAATPPAAATSPAMSSLMGGGGDAGPMGMDVSQTGPSGLRAGLGMRNPPQYNYALASLGRGVY